MKSPSSHPVMATEVNQSLIPGAVRRRVLASALAVAFASIPTVSFADHSWGGYHWARMTNPFTVQLGDNVSAAWDTYLPSTSSDWSVSPVLDTAVVQRTTDPKRCAATNGIVQVCNYKYGNRGWLGVAQIWISGGHITQGTVKVNDSYFNTARYNTPAWRNLVMCQEVGHTLGLDHVNETFGAPNAGTCMDYTSDPDGGGDYGPSNERPNAHDYEQLGIIYSHLDSATTVAASSNVIAMPREMRDGDFSERIQWGALVRSSKNGLKEVYRRDFGGGYQIVTFVTWAEGEGRGRH